MQAKDLMTCDVLTVGPMTEIAAAAKLFAEHRISGAPVVDGRGRLLGAISQSDLTRFQGLKPVEGWETVEAQREKAPVASVMTSPAVTCEEETSAEALAELMRLRHIHRVFVTRDGLLRGVVSTLDLLRAIPCEERRPKGEA